MINSFDGKYYFLSNFYPHPIIEDEIVYPTNEHYFQAMKSLIPEERRKIAACRTPGDAKRLGRRIALRSDWEQIKLGIMENALRLKFKDPKLSDMLKATGNKKLVEGNRWNDTYWGVCRGVGKNHLGRLLMKVRSDL